MIIDFAAGTINVLVTYLLSIPINSLVVSLVNIPELASLKPIYELVLIGGSMVLTLISAFFSIEKSCEKRPGCGFENRIDTLFQFPVLKAVKVRLMKLYP